MPKKIRLAINLVVSTVLLIVLMMKASKTLGNFAYLKELWHIGESHRFFSTAENGASWLSIISFVFGAYILIALTAVSVWTRGVLPIVLSAVSSVLSFVLLCCESLFARLFNTFEVTQYMGFDPFITMAVCFSAFVMLAVSIAELVIQKTKNRF